MSNPGALGPTPAASFPLPPPLAMIQMVDPRTGRLTIAGLSYHTQLWAGIQGSGGLSDQTQTIFGMHNDGTLSPDGELTVVSSEGRPFVQSAFTDTTDATNITSGAMDQERVSGLGQGVAFADLPAPAAGLRNFVTDSTIAAAGNFGTAITVGGGAIGVPVWSEGSGWFVG